MLTYMDGQKEDYAHEFLPHTEYYDDPTSRLMRSSRPGNQLHSHKIEQESCDTIYADEGKDDRTWSRLRMTFA